MTDCDAGQVLESSRCFAFCLSSTVQWWIHLMSGPVSGCYWRNTVCSFFSSQQRQGSNRSCNLTPLHVHHWFSWFLQTLDKFYLGSKPWSVLSKTIWRTSPPPQLAQSWSHWATKQAFHLIQFHIMMTDQKNMFYKFYFISPARTLTYLYRLEWLVQRLWSVRYSVQ